ncbi:MAG: transposase, partial [Giesbergeria sp.]|nr:transposase [Giesbergeria sp.]
DMSKAFIAGVGQHLPQAAIAFDGFHVVQLANRAVDAVRRQEAGGKRRALAQEDPLVLAQGQRQVDRWIGCPTPDSRPPGRGG